MTVSNITQDLLNELFEYNEKTGMLTRKIYRAPNAQKGDILNTKDKDGYYITNLNNKVYRVHHLIWCIKYGYIPKLLDHIDHNTSNNTLDNLREVEQSDNVKNQSLAKHNTSGFTGVYQRKSNGKWLAFININGKPKHLGSFNHIEDAKRCRINANKEYGFHENHGKERVA